MKIKRNAAILIAAATVGALGAGGVISANADSGSPSHGNVSNQGTDGETNDDATDTGPDANPNEPGHQDASDIQGDGDGEVPDAQESDNN